MGLQLLAVVVAIGLAQKATAAEEEWGYNEDNGPSTWGGDCQTGERQSPVDIKLDQVVLKPMGKINFENYEQHGPVTVTNNGHGVEVYGFHKWGEKRPYITGGGLPGTYELLQYHFHWAQSNCTGSEHTIDSLHYPVEAHLVHIKKGFKAGELFENDTLAVIGVFIAEGPNGEALADIAPSFCKLVQPGSKETVEQNGLTQLLPRDTESYFRYDGSLTTPNCNESVIWTVMAEPIMATPRQLEALRNVHFLDGKVGHNNRPTQPLNDRTVFFTTALYNFVYSTLQWH